MTPQEIKDSYIRLFDIISARDAFIREYIALILDIGDKEPESKP